MAAVGQGGLVLEVQGEAPQVSGQKNSGRDRSLGVQPQDTRKSLGPARGQVAGRAGRTQGLPLTSQGILSGLIHAGACPA